MSIRLARFGFLAILTLSFGQCWAGPPLRRSFSVRHIPLRSGERIVGFEFHIVAGAFQKLDSLPVGWYLTIDNDASWQPSVEANAQVGAASLSQSSLQKLRVGILENEFGDLKLHLSGTVIVTADFVNERRIDLTTENFTMK